MGHDTAFTVVHTCGHRRSHDLSMKPAAERAGFARLLAWTACDTCSPSHGDTDEATDDPEANGSLDRPITTRR